MPSLKDIEIKENSKFLKLEEGQNIVRIVSDFIIRQVTFKTGSTSTKYSCWVINRKNGHLIMADFGASIIKQLKALSESPEYAFDQLPGYDITITRLGTGMDTEYTVTPARKDTPLTDEEKSLIELAGSLQTFIDNLESKQAANSPVKVDEIPF